MFLYLDYSIFRLCLCLYRGYPATRESLRVPELVLFLLQDTRQRQTGMLY